MTGTLQSTFLQQHQTMIVNKAQDRIGALTKIKFQVKNNSKTMKIKKTRYTKVVIFHVIAREHNQTNISYQQHPMQNPE